MPIPEGQLAIWAHPGATTAAKATHEAVRRALEAPGSPLAGKRFEVYLQGSYRNDTNTRGDSDVDIVVQLNESFWKDVSELAPEEQTLCASAFPNATYLWPPFRADVLVALRNHFGRPLVSEGNRCLRVQPAPGRLSADIVPALEFRRYRRFRSFSDQEYVCGIKFLARDGGRKIVNYPKEHYQNGVAKNQENRTGGQYKPGVRLFKNARLRLEERGIVPEDAAPSYFLECLLYNVPDEAYGGTWQEAYCAIVNWLRGNLSSYLNCQNEQLRLFGDTPEQWSSDRAKQVVEGLVQLWNGW